MVWSRPEKIPVGQIWRRFTGRTKDGAAPNQYVIIDARPEDFKTALDFMETVFIRDEPLCQALDILPSDRATLAEIRSNWEEYLSHRVAISCHLEEAGQIGQLIAFNTLLVKCADDPPDDLSLVKSEPYRKLLATLIETERRCDVFQKYGVDKYLTSSGLTVSPEHRGQNIAAEMFRAREPLCRAMGLSATATVFTAVTSQALAAKCGYTTLAELRYSEMLAFGIDLSRSSTPTAKLMGTKYV